MILSNGDVVFQPHKIERSGIAEAVDNRVLIYIHKEETLDDRVTTIFPSQRQYARDANAYPGG